MPGFHGDTALAQERDELLVLLDLQERQRFEALRPLSCDNDLPYNDFSSPDVCTLKKTAPSLYLANMHQSSR